MPLKHEKVLLREIENLKAGIRTCQGNAMLEESGRKVRIYVPPRLSRSERKVYNCVFYFRFYSVHLFPLKMLNQRHELIEKRKMKTNNISEAYMGLQKLKLVEYCGRCCFL